MGEDVGRVQLESKKLVDEGDSTSRSSGWIDIFRVDRHLQGGSTSSGWIDIFRPSKQGRQTRKGNLPSPIGIRVSATSKKTSPGIGHISETITQPITRWWLSFNPFENYANVKLDHLFPPRIRVKIQKKNIWNHQPTSRPVGQVTQMECATSCSSNPFATCFTPGAAFKPCSALTRISCQKSTDEDWLQDLFLG